METITTNKKNLLLASLLLVVSIGYSQFTQTFSTAGSTNFTIPANVTSVQVEAWGGGGGGASAANASGGGGGGAYTIGTLTGLTPGNTLTVNVGAGGGVGSSGNPSSVNSIQGNGGTNGNNRTGGAGGAASTISGFVTASYAGGNGGNARNSSGGGNNEAGGGGGGSAFNNAAGNAGANGGSSTTVATAGGTGTGTGGVGAAADGNPTASAGTAPGAGGGGRGEGASSSFAGADGQVILTWCPTYALTAAATATGPFCGASTSTVTLRSSSMTSGTYTVTYNLSGLTTAVGNTASMTFTAGSPGTGTFTTTALNGGGVTTITITSIAASGCSSVISTNNTATVTVNNPPTSNAGSNVTTCAGNGAVNITFGASISYYTFYVWTSSGTGTFVNPNSTTLCTYNPSAADIAAGSVTLTLTVTGTAPCGTAISTKTLTINQAPTAAAGSPMSTCSSTGAVNITAGSTATNYATVTWTSSGTGTFANPTSLTTCTYTPSAADIAAGSVILTLTATNAGCSNATSTKTLTIVSAATAAAGTPVSVCYASGAINITAGSSATNYNTITWTSSGTGTFANANSLTTCTYTPSAADISAGSVTLTLTATGNAPCANATSTKLLSIPTAPTAAAGTAILACSSTGAVNITTGSSAANYSAIAWTSSGTGTFANATSLTTCTYTPSAADITAGSVTITLTATATAPCSNATSTKTLTITRAATAAAGTAITTCSTSGAVNITTGSSAANYNTITWTASGTGTFVNANSLTTCTYTPSAADIAAGTVTLTLTATGNAPCSNAVSTKTLTITTTPTVAAGSAMSTCSSSGTLNITTGSTASNYTTVTWSSSGTGVITNPNSLTTCTYNPSAADIAAGIVTLTLTGVNGTCSAVSTKTLTIVPPPTAVAGTAINMCNAVGATNITAGSSATNYASLLWTSSGTGTFANANSLTTCTYTPSAADNLAGGVTLTLTVTGLSPCGNAVSTKSLTIYGPTATAGTTVTTCSTSGAVNITAGSSATNYTSIAWTSSGTGTFANATSLTTCTYTPSAADIAAGNVTITLTASQVGCSNDTSSKTLTIYATPTIVSTVPASRTGTGTVILGATPSVGTAYWYAALTGGSSLGFGTSFTTPSIAATTTFYVEATNGTCTSTPRTAVVATVNSVTMTVTGNAAAIANGSITTSTANWTDFASTNATRTFTINNTGAGIMNIGAISFSGANASEFTVTTAPSNSVGPGSSTTFVVTFNPTAAGTRTATISIVNNDSLNNPYTFAIQGTGVVQGITIQGNASSITNGAVTTTTANWTDFSTVTNTRTFTITNTGNVVLTIGAITFSGTNASEFTIQTAPSATVAAYGTTTFTVLFTPTAAGVRNATIRIVNNDSTKNPFTYALSGTGTPQLSSVTGNAASITYGSTTPTTANWTDFSTVAVTRTFTIINSGTIPLSIGAITFTGANPTEFSVQTPPSSIVPALGSTTFTVLFTPSTTGVRTAVLNIANGDTTKNPFYFTIRGTGVTQAITLSGNATGITNGALTTSTSNWTDFSTVASTRTFTITNTGNLPLTVGTISFSGTNAADFTLQTAPSTTVAALGTTTFTVLFTPSASGTRNATISIVNGDSTKNPFTYAISGTGGTLTMTLANANGVLIADGDTTPTAPKQTDFGTVSIDSGSVTVTYTIKNTGTGTLSLGAVTFTGTNAADFSLSLAPSATLAAGASTTLQVDFNPTLKGTKTATFNIVTNATGMNPFNFDITGLGVQTYLDTDGDGVTDNKDLDDDNDGITDIKEQTDALSYPLNNLLTYTFLNETFGAGQTKGKININIPGATTTSCYEDNITTNPNSCGTNASGVLDDGEYVVNYIVTNTNGVSSDPENIHHDLAWTDQRDHTGDLYGRMAIYNSDNTAGTYFYQAVINGILPNTQTTFSFWVMNLMRQGNLGSTILPNITIEFRDVTGATLIASYNTGNIGRCSASNPLDNTCGPSLSNWLNYTTTVSLGNITDFIIKIRNNAPGGGGNDFAMDDIKITQTYVDSDGDGVANIFDLDDENDGIPDIEEAGFKAYSNGTSKMATGTWVDANANGILDAIDAQISGGTYLVADTDGDGVPNYLDLDSDNDSIYDINEGGLTIGDGDINDDGKGDGADTDHDGILDLNDNSAGFGTTAKVYALDTDSNGTPDYMQLDSNSDGIKDIQTGLYASLDANNDGKIDGATDLDKDGILDSFDTNTTVIGSPRDLNRKLYLDFDGRNDYGQDSAILGGLANASLMAWVDLNAAFSTTGLVVGQTKFQLRINSSKQLEAVVNSTTLTYSTTALSSSRWYHVAAVYGGGLLKLYLNGVMVTSVAAAGSIAADASKLTLGKDPASNTNYFKGKIDEVRVFNTALTDAQVQRMVYQEIQNTSSNVRGAIVPYDIGSLPFSNVLRCYRMDAFKDDIVDDITTASIDVVTGMKIYNNKSINVQQAPMPFVTQRTGTFATAIDNPTNDVRGLDAMDQDWSIVQVKHDIAETANNIDLAMFVDPGKTITMNNDTKIQNDWYLKLDGKIDLQGKSQLVQTTNSILDTSSAGSIERDQQGQSNFYNYNYWSSPVGTMNNTSNNNSFTVNGVLRDGTDPNNIQPITWTSGYNGAATTPITLSSYWIFKFQNLNPQYANWSAVGQNGALLAAQGFTLKGSGAGTSTQNYTFVGKPNSGTITVPIAPGNLNLCGNPYPSALDANAFITANSSVITGSLYFWEHYGTNSSHNLLDYQGGYAARSLVGGTPPVSPAGVSGLGSSSRVPGRFIPVGQGFLVYGSGTGGTITFDNSQRAFVKENDATSNVMFRQNAQTHSIVESQFYNKEDAFVETTTYKKIRLGFDSANNYHRQILLGFMEGLATDGFDVGYDAPQIDSQPNDFYFANGSQNYVIQGVGYFNANSTYPLNIKSGVAGTVKIMLDDKENIDDSQPIYIYDAADSTYHDIRTQPYEINLAVGNISDRFSLRFTSSALGVTNFAANNDITIAYAANDSTLNICNKTVDNVVQKVTLFNILGQSINTWDIKNMDQTKIQIPVMNLSTGTYIVQVHTTNGDISKKIIIN